MPKPLSYQIEAADLLAITRGMTDKQIAKWFRKFIFDLIARDSEETYTSDIIREAKTRRDRYMPSSQDWKKIRKRILERDNFTCTYCGITSDFLEVDHILPVSKGGGHNDENLTTSCPTCNRNKGSKTIEEWVR